MEETRQSMKSEADRGTPLLIKTEATSAMRIATPKHLAGSNLPRRYS